MEYTCSFSLELALGPRQSQADRLTRPIDSPTQKQTL